MQNLVTKNSIGFGTIFSGALFLSLFGLMIWRDNFFEIVAPESDQVSESNKASREIAEIILKLDSVALDTSVLKSSYFQNITVLPVYPTDSRTRENFGKANPFLGTFVAATNQAPGVAAASSTVGGLIYSQQRSVNGGNSILPVTNGQGQAPQGRR